MPIPTHLKFTVRGNFKDSPEQWSTGFHMSRAIDGGGDTGLGDIHVDDVDAAMSAFFGSSLFTTKVELVDWRAYVIGTNGKMEGNAPLLREYEPGELVGTGSMNNAHPPQVAVVASTVAVNRGAAQFGRMYLPGITFPIGADWILSAGNAATIVGSVVQFLKDVSDAIDVPLAGSTAGVNVSRGPIGSPTGTIQEIDHVRVGRVFDTVRNRRKSLLEQYQLSGHIDW